MALPYNAGRQRPPREFHETDLNNDQHILEFVEGRWRTRTQRRLHWERSWLYQVAMFAGQQWLDWSNSARRLVSPPAPTWRQRLTINRIQVVARKTLANVLRQQPIWTVVPATGDVDDMATAGVSSKVLEGKWYELLMDEKLVELFSWVSVCGNGFLRTYWDKTAGGEMTVKPSDLDPKALNGDSKDPSSDGVGRMQKIFGGRKRDQRKGKRVMIGDVGIEVLSPFQVDLVDDETDFCRTRGVIDTRMRSPLDIEELHGVKLPPDTTRGQSITAFFQDQLANLSGAASGQFTSSGQQEKSQIIEHTISIRACPKHPKGLWATIGGGKVLARGDLEQGFPYEFFSEIKVPGRFWGTCALEQCIPMQLEVNRGRSQMVETRNIHSKPKWLIPNGSGVPVGSPTSEPGEKIPYQGMARPEQITPPPIPAYVAQTIQHAIDDIEQVSAQHEPTNAQAPGSVRSGVGIAQLQEADFAILAPFFLTSEQALARSGKTVLQLIHAHYKEKRLSKMVGPNYEVDSFFFLGGDLMGKQGGKPNVDYFDVRVRLGSQLPQSKQGRIQFVIDMVQNGIWHPETHGDKIEEVLRIGADERLLTDKQLDRQNAMRNNIEMMKTKKPAMVHPSDDHAVHLDSLRRFQKLPAYRKALEKDPELDLVFQAVADAHREEEERAIAHANFLAGGAPPPGPGGGGGGQPNAQPPLGEGVGDLLGAVADSGVPLSG